MKDTERGRDEAREWEFLLVPEANSACPLHLGDWATDVNKAPF